MISSEIFPFLVARPFAPFQLELISGRTFRIESPYDLLLGRNYLMIYESQNYRHAEYCDPTEVANNWHTIGISLITGIEACSPCPVN